MSDAELRDELVTLLVAGHETTATALAWAVERLVRHPDKLERLTAEVARRRRRVPRRRGPGDAAPAAGDLARQPHADRADRDRRLRLPAGVKVAPCIYLVHRRPDIYPEPERFLPERFLDNPPGTYTWIPFGGGVRRCLGGAFAQFEMKVVLRELVRRRRSSRLAASRERVYRRAITETPRHDAEVLVR